MTNEEWAKLYTPGDILQHRDGSIYIVARFKGDAWYTKIIVELDTGVRDNLPSDNEWCWFEGQIGALTKVGHAEL